MKTFLAYIYGIFFSRSELVYDRYNITIHSQKKRHDFPCGIYIKKTKKYHSITKCLQDFIKLVCHVHQRDALNTQLQQNINLKIFDHRTMYLKQKIDNQKAITDEF